MSTKTLRKRIALVAVSALGAGLLSVVPMSSANAAANDGVIDSTAGSIGLVGALTGTGTTRTAVLLSTGSLLLSPTSPATFKVSAGAVITGATTSSVISGDQTCAANVGASEFVTITPRGAIGSTFTVTTYDDATCAAPGAISNIVTVTIAGSSVSGVPTAANSAVYWHTSANEVTADTSGASAAAPLGQLFLDIDLADAYDAAFNDASGALVATVSSGATVALTAAAATTVGTFTTAVSGETASDRFVVITEATAGAGWSGTVTISYNGVVIATKTGSITGYATVITTTRNKVATAATSTTDAVRFKATDAAGNSVVIAAGSLTMKSSSNTAVVSNVVGVTDQVITAGSLADGKATVFCGTPGTSSVVMQYTTPAGKTITAAPLTVICGGSASTYTAAFNKAVYVQGELATLTVSFKDAFGAPEATASAVAALNGGTPNISNEIIVAPMMTLVGAASTTALVTNADGNVVFTYSVGATTGITPGAYQASVSFPTVNSVKGVAQAVGYTVSAPAGVSNADVLKAIVSLIASINKQIAALQKALLKK
jgi:hypothetical protein